MTLWTATDILVLPPVPARSELNTPAGTPESFFEVGTLNRMDQGITWSRRHLVGRMPIFHAKFVHTPRRGSRTSGSRLARFLQVQIAGPCVDYHVIRQDLAICVRFALTAMAHFSAHNKYNVSLGIHVLLEGRERATLWGDLTNVALNCRGGDQLALVTTASLDHRELPLSLIELYRVVPVLMSPRPARLRGFGKDIGAARICPSYSDMTSLARSEAEQLLPDDGTGPGGQQWILTRRRTCIAQARESSKQRRPKTDGF